MDALRSLVQPLVNGSSVIERHKVRCPRRNGRDRPQSEQPGVIFPDGAPITSFLSSTFLSRTPALSSHTTRPRAGLCGAFPTFFRHLRIPPYTFIDTFPRHRDPALPRCNYHPNSLRPPSRAHSPRLPLPTCHIHPVSLLAHTLPPYSLPVFPLKSSLHSFLHFCLSRAYPHDPPAFLPSPAFPHPSSLSLSLSLLFHSTFSLRPLCFIPTPRLCLHLIILTPSSSFTASNGTALAN
ncbi:hypothetical protein B0H16DRAFT_1896867 [Mycena metata]|uniref:Uncharacterized protein n=1 Tax=Mycena metata TaxID=1033252 RepID=A0AAD7HHI1_9AGAR|nr:hypothetical protein B0H16DRAFT_1896867 [Mycena metata]